jgi:hypothetical protein
MYHKRPFHPARLLAIGACWVVSSVLIADDTPAWLESGEFSWSASAPLIGPMMVEGDEKHSIKDPTVVHHDGEWHLFCTVRGRERSHGIVYLHFADWADAANAEQVMLPMHAGYFCAPQVFYFSPHEKWYLICQAASEEWDPEYQPAFSTTGDIADPHSWTELEPLYGYRPGNITGWIDFWVICDEERAHLFYTSNDGNMWRSETPIGEFPHAWSEPVLALQGDIFEASHTYHLAGDGRFLTIVEAENGHGWRYYKAYLADSLDGEWRPLAATRDESFASLANVEQAAGHWTDSISHGELLRSGVNERLEIDADNLQLLFQGVLETRREGKVYGEIPWKLGLLELRE